MRCVVWRELNEKADAEWFSSDTCTMAIIMLAAFHPGELPGVPAHKLYGLMDVASYSDVWNAVKQVKDNCISVYVAVNETMSESGEGINFRSQTGWSAIGMCAFLTKSTSRLLKSVFYRK